MPFPCSNQWKVQCLKTRLRCSVCATWSTRIKHLTRVIFHQLHIFAQSFGTLASKKWLVRLWSYRSVGLSIKSFKAIKWHKFMLTLLRSCFYRNCKFSILYVNLWGLQFDDESSFVGGVVNCFEKPFWRAFSTTNKFNFPWIWHGDVLTDLFHDSNWQWLYGVINEFE